MKREELIRKIKALGRKRNIPALWDEKRGKGSHGTMTYGILKTTIPKGELKIKTLHSILEKLGINSKDI